MSVRKRVFELTHPNAAGIDVGAASHFVGVPPDRDEQAVREYPSFTEDLNRLADWLTACEVDTVAMESTGVTGSLCSSCWSRAGSRCIWSMRGI